MANLPRRIRRFSNMFLRSKSCQDEKFRCASRTAGEARRRGVRRPPMLTAVGSGALSDTPSGTNTVAMLFNTWMKNSRNYVVSNTCRVGYRLSRCPTAPPAPSQHDGEQGSETVKGARYVPGALCGLPAHSALEKD
jgi:hypothetical protein